MPNDASCMPVALTRGTLWAVVPYGKAFRLHGVNHASSYPAGSALAVQVGRCANTTRLAPSMPNIF